MAALPDTYLSGFGPETVHGGRPGPFASQFLRETDRATCGVHQ